MRKIGDKNKKPAMFLTSIRIPEWVYDYYKDNGFNAMMRKVLTDHAAKKVPKRDQV